MKSFVCVFAVINKTTATVATTVRASLGKNMVRDGEKGPNCVVGTVGKRDSTVFKNLKKNPKKK
jgi:hypothetical protein